MAADALCRSFFIDCCSDCNCTLSKLVVSINFNRSAYDSSTFALLSNKDRICFTFFMGITETNNVVKYNKVIAAPLVSPASASAMASTYKAGTTQVAIFHNEGRGNSSCFLQSCLMERLSNNLSSDNIPIVLKLRQKSSFSESSFTASCLMRISPLSLSGLPTIPARASFPMARLVRLSI